MSSSELLDKKTITVDFYKPSGKWYTGGTAEVTCYFFDKEDFLDEISDTCSCLRNWDWRDSEFDLVTSYKSEDPKDTYFCNRIWKLGNEDW